MEELFWDLYSGTNIRRRDIKEQDEIVEDLKCQEIELDEFLIPLAGFALSIIFMMI
jgi:hypothetical protein